MTDVFKYPKSYFVNDGAELFRVVPDQRTINNEFELYDLATRTIF